MNKRRPYIRSMDGWWRKNPFFVEYIIHESTALFILVYALILLFGLVRLGQGEVAWNGWLECMKSPLSIMLHLVLLVAVAYHAYTWFKVMPVTMPPLKLGERKIQPIEIVRGGFIAALGASVLLFVLVWGLAR